MYVGFSQNVTDGIYVAKDWFIINIHHIYKQVDILISKNQVLQLLYLKHHVHTAS